MISYDTYYLRVDAWRSVVHDLSTRKSYPIIPDYSSDVCCDEALWQLKAVEPHELILRAKVGHFLVGCEYWLWEGLLQVLDVGCMDSLIVSTCFYLPSGIFNSYESHDPLSSMIYPWISCWFSQRAKPAQCHEASDISGQALWHWVKAPFQVSNNPMPLVIYPLFSPPVNVHILEHAAFWDKFQNPMDFL